MCVSCENQHVMGVYITAGFQGTSLMIHLPTTQCHYNSSVSLLSTSYLILLFSFSSLGLIYESNLTTQIFSLHFSLSLRFLVVFIN